MILLVGASATGKSEVAKKLLECFKMKKAITHTTRQKRKGEIDGVDYYFVDENSFLSLWEKGELLENTIYNGNHYGCSKKEIQDDKCVILDPNGINSFLRSENPRLVVFYLSCSKEVRKKRMKSRGDSNESIQARLDNDEKTFDPKKMARIDFYIDSEKGSPEEIASQIHRLYIQELSKR